MSEKVTFQELIESIAEESNNSKQFTHDFLKDFVDVINGGLEQDGNVNIAGFGKFELRHVDEREGYNPQTEEKMTIPAHNKIVFKPYKDVRELVNAPYAHLEPELIDEEDEQEDTDAASSTEENAPQDDFLPTAPPTEHESEEKSNSPKETHEDPFGLDEGSSESSSSSFSLEEESKEQAKEDEDDVVEFRGDSSGEDVQHADEKLSEFIGETESSKEETEGGHDQAQTNNDTEQNTSDEQEPTVSEDKEDDEADSRYTPNKHHEDSPEPEKANNENEDKQTVPQTPAFDQNLPRRERDSSLPVIAAAAGILLLLAAGAWYFGFLGSTDSSQQASQQQIASTEMSQKTNSNQQKTSPAQQADRQQQSFQQPDQQATRQSQSQASNAQSDSRTTQDNIDTEEHAIADGQTLWSIAEDKYGNPRLWPWIYGKNGKLANPDVIIAGQSLDVPLPSGPQNRLNATDSVGVAKGYLATYNWYKKNGSSDAKNHLWGAKLYHSDIRNLADIQIDKADLSYANKAR